MKKMTVWKWILSAFTSGSGIITLVTGLALAGGLSFGYNYFITGPAMAKLEAKVDEQNKLIGVYTVANASLTKALADSTKAYEDNVKQIEKLNGIIANERQRADVAEAGIEADSMEREALEAAGQAEQVLDSDIAQEKCLNANFGKPGGRCLKGKWTPD